VTSEAAKHEPVHILVVDDEDTLRDALARYLRSQSYVVQAVSNGTEALDELRQRQFELMLLDIRMPGMSGIDVVTEALDANPDIAIIMLSAMNDATMAAICMQRGAMDYLTKPIELTDLLKSIERALRQRHTLMEGRQISAWLREEISSRSAELARERLRLETLIMSTMEVLVNAMESKDPYLSGHSARVAAVSATIANELGLPDDEIEHVRQAGRLHDIGKVGIRENVLNKTGPLTSGEYEHVKDHVLVGSQILAPLKLGQMSDYVRGHHEHFDGSGYPDGLKGDQIPLGARILCAAEVYDALTTARPYQEKMTPEGATEHMRQLSGTVIDPKVMDALAAAIGRRRTLVFLSVPEPSPE